MNAVFRAVLSVFLMGTVAARAGDILRGGAATSGSAHGRGGKSAINSEAAAAASRQNARDRLARTTEAVMAMRTLQAQARATAAGANNLGLNPHHPGLTLPDVPEGLAPGGLDILGVPRGALAPRQSGGDGGVTVTVRQTESQALLDWKTFNVGKRTTLQFDQSGGGVDAGKWIAFNRVTDPSGAPSQILGSIKSDGQVYVINQNGIIFGGASQINTRALVASSLPINENLVNRGLLNNPDAQFLFSALSVPAGTKGPSPAFTPPAAFTPSGRPGDVVVQKGAVLAAPTTAEKVGGRITLIGPNVLNEGTISTPDGQTILAAGLQVGFAAHPGADPSLRGLDVFVGAAEYAPGERAAIGTATNRGLIEIPRANATIIGKRVQQMGVIDSVTSVALNGRVDLVADYGAVGNGNYDATKPTLGPIFDNRASGLVELGPGSVIRILPEGGKAETTVGTSLSLPSLASIQGQAIHFAQNSILLAPGASLPGGSNTVVPVDASGAALGAGISVNAGNWLSASAITPGQRRFTGGQIYFEKGALIDVAGSVDVAAPIDHYLLTVQLRGAELANSPLQRTSMVRGQSITVDLRKSGVYNGAKWIGTPLGDVSGYAGLIQRTAAELTTAGGTVNLNAGESVVMQPGSQIDVSGGWVNLAGGKVRTTRLLERGRLVNIADATPDRVYDGIYDGTLTRTHAKWGVTKTYVAALAPTGEYEQKGYMQGANAGSLAINAPSMALDGKLTGQAVQGPRQSSPTTLALAKPGSLSLTFKATESLTPFLAFSPTPPEVVFSSDKKLPAALPFSLSDEGGLQELRAERKETVLLSPTLLTDSGFGSLTVENSDGSITVPVGADLHAPLQGSITLKAALMEIAGNITAPGGSIDLAVYNFSPHTQAKLVPGVSSAPSPDPTRGVFALGPQARLSAAGLITDYRPGSPGPANQPPLIDGGSVSINAYTAILAPGSEIDVSGGVSSSFTGKRTYGAAGSIAINAGRDPGLPLLVGGKLLLGSTLKGFSGVQGGSLTITAPLIQIGGTLPALIPWETGLSSQAPPSSPASVLAQSFPEGTYRFGNADVFPGELLFLSPEFFSQGGFTSFTLRGLGKAIPGVAGQVPTVDEFLPAINIAPGTVIRPVALSQRTDPRPGPQLLSLKPFRKADGLREPVSLAFLAPTTQDIYSAPSQNTLRGDIVMGEGAVIETEPLGNVSFEGSTVSILGTVVAPGGKIVVKGANAFPLSVPSVPPAELDQALPTVHLGPRSVLSAAGRVVLRPDPYGRRVGSVLPGGSITVSGNIVAQAGALLDVSGASGIFDLHPDTLVANLNAPRLVPPNSGLNSKPYALRTVPVQVDSDAGTIALRGAQELFTDATLRGFAGGPSARGGTLEIASGRYISPLGTGLSSPLDANLLVAQAGRTIPGDYGQNGGKVIGNPVPLPRTAVPGEERLGRGHFSVSSFAEGGFDSLKLSGIGSGQSTGAVQFSGPVSIQARRSLAVSDGGVIYADADVLLEAPHVILGAAFASPLLATQLTSLTNGGGYFPPTFGPGRLTVKASLIDIGNLSLQNISRATFIAENGDIRGNGTLNAAGEIQFRAGQIYPTTASRFTIVAYDPNITVAASSVGSNQVTLASEALPPGFGVGAPLLGSTVTQINGATVTLAGNANATIGSPTPVTFAPGTGSVTIAAAGERPLPLSAGGMLSIYASNITQGGTLRAPLGTINLGWDGVGASPVDYLTGAGLQTGNTVPVTRRLTLAGGSVTSVSAVDPRTGQGILIPYGFSPDGTSWVDPTGVDITAGLAPQKTVNLSAEILLDQAGSVIDVRGGGDLFASRFVTGNVGTHDILGSPAAGWLASENYTAGDLVSHQGRTWSARRTSKGSAPDLNMDWALIPESFAVIPGYEANYVPFAAFNNRPDSLNLAISDPGYVNGNLSVGDKIYLGASNGLAAGAYTLLPARYALLPGAVLVTPKSGDASRTVLLAEGNSIVSGYRFNDLNRRQLTPAQAVRFEVAPQSVLAARAQYDGFLANTFLKESALDLGITVPRLPEDSGRVALSGRHFLQLDGHIFGKPVGKGFGAEIDISTEADILITGGGRAGPPGTVVLDAGRLSSFGADSILIGGLRTFSDLGTSLTVNTGRLVVDNAGTPLTAPELILVAKNQLTLAPGAQIVQAGSTRGSALKANLQTLNPEDLPLAIKSAFPVRIGDAAVPGSGNGLLLRVSDNQVPVIRSGVASQAAQAALTQPPTMTIGSGASVSAGAITLDSTYGTSLDPTASLLGRDIALHSGQIILKFDNPGLAPSIPGLTLSGPVLQGLQTAESLSLLSYSSIDLYGSGRFTAVGALALHGAQIRGFHSGGGTVTFAARDITLDNIGGGTALSSGGAQAGRLIFDAGTILLGEGQLGIDQYAGVALNAAGGLLVDGTGGLTTQGALEILAPLLTAADAANHAITAQGNLDVRAPAGASTATVSGGLGGALSLTGAAVSVNSDIRLDSGLIRLRATTGDLLVGNLGPARLEAAGTAQAFHDLTRFTHGGHIFLTADTGSVTLGSAGTVRVAAQPGGGNAGAVSVSAAQGSFTMLGTLFGQGGAEGNSGAFALDVLSLPQTSAVDSVLNAANFGHARSYRVRSGNVTVDGLALAHNYLLSADQGDITVSSSGFLNASGPTAGTIGLQAFGNLTLQAGSHLSVAGADFNSAGQGGTITLEAGTTRNRVVGPGYLDIQAGSLLDLSVASKIAINPATDATTPGTSAYNGQFSGKLHLRAPRNAAGTDLLINAINGTIIDPSSIVVEGYRLYDLTDFGGTVNSAVQARILSDGQTFLGAAGVTTPGYTAMTDRLFANNAGLTGVAVLAPGVELVNAASAATLSYQLNTVGSVLTIPAAGGTVYFPNGTPGNSTVRSSLAGVITAPDGTVTTLPANTNRTIAAGSSITLSSGGNLTYAAGAGGPITVGLAPGSSYTTGATGVAGVVSAPGSVITMNSNANSSIALAAGTRIAFPAGTLGASRIRSTVAGTITSPTGVVTVLAANTNTAIAAGSYVQLNSAGTITSPVVSGGAIEIALAAGSFTTSGATTSTPSTGNLTLGSPTSTTTSDWNLASYRFGAKSAPGILTLRAAGDLVFYNALSDGFTPTLSSGDSSWLYTAELSNANPLLPLNTQSWSYRLASGADLSAADFRAVQPLSSLAANMGSLRLGKLVTTNNGNPTATGGANALTSAALAGRYQVIRTGSGDITISAGRDVQLLNQFATIYSAGTRVFDPTLGGNFEVPPSVDIGVQDPRLGIIQQSPTYAAQYSLGGGNVFINAQHDITHLTQAGGVLVADSQKQIPNNWLYRRGYVDPITGEFGVTRDGDIASTTWWVDFSNFFQGVGALGGGNVSLLAGHDISNVDAVAPTNARMTFQTASGNRLAASQPLLELGGGDVTVRAGRNIDAGIYYVERGRGVLEAGGSIITNKTRSASLGSLATPAEFNLSPAQWLPTTLFLGKGGFDVSAAGDLLLGPTVNPFLLPGGLNNSYWRKSYFSTYAPDSEVNVTSLGGSVTLRQNSTLSGLQGEAPILRNWMESVHLLRSNPRSVSFLQPWLRLVETNLQPFDTFFTVLPSTVRATAFSGDINLVGRFNLSPAPLGTLELAGAGAINGLQHTGVLRNATTGNLPFTTWSSAVVNLSDASPDRIPGLGTPYGYQARAGIDESVASLTATDFLLFVSELFRESGSSLGTQSVIQTQQALHGTSLLHAADPEPIRLYAGGGNISGLTLFSAKAAKIVAAGDISDISFYIQNTKNSDLSVVSSGRNIIAYNANSLLRVSAQSPGNLLNTGQEPLAGDLQISGPGALAVLAGRNLDLGVGLNNADGTGVGLTSIGNARNPNLPFAGASIIAAAGVGPAAALSGSSLDFATLISQIVVSPEGAGYLAEVASAIPGLPPGLDLNGFQALDPELQARVALEIFYLVLRDAGRNSTLAGSPGFGNYATGFAAIDALFGNSQSEGEITTRSRDIRTRSGGNISLLAPGGGLTLTTSAIGPTLVPPGIITEAGGNISIFTRDNVDIGISRIFTLRGGNQIIWSSAGDIAAGSSPKTVQSAPPTRVLIDAQSAELKVDLAGLATGGGIGVLATVGGVEPGNVDLIAPFGTVDAGDAGIRATGNLNIAAVQVLNADNIAVGGRSTGVPTAPVAAVPNIAGLTAASNTSAAATSAATEAASKTPPQQPEEEAPSLITVDILGYGGGEED